MVTKEEAQDLLARLKTLRYSLVEIRGYLDSYKKGINPFPDALPAEHNVIFISPHIKVLFEECMQKPMPYPSVVGLFETWTLELMGGLIGNRHHLVQKKHKKLLRHFEDIYAMCMKFELAEAGLNAMMVKLTSSPPPRFPTRPTPPKSSA